MDTHGYFILSGEKDVLPATESEWLAWFEDPRSQDLRQVQRSFVGHIMIATIFIGLPRSMYQSAVFGGALTGRTIESSTLGEALAMHEHLLSQVNASLDERKPQA